MNIARTLRCILIIYFPCLFKLQKEQKYTNTEIQNEEKIIRDKDEDLKEIDRINQLFFEEIETLIISRENDMEKIIKENYEIEIQNLQNKIKEKEIMLETQKQEYEKKIFDLDKENK
jgi:hypothetical protein